MDRFGKVSRLGTGGCKILAWIAKKKKKTVVIPYIGIEVCTIGLGRGLLSMAIRWVLLLFSFTQKLWYTSTKMLAWVSAWPVACMLFQFRGTASVIPCGTVA